jgi:hypothetical protein
MVDDDDDYDIPLPDEEVKSTKEQQQAAMEALRLAGQLVLLTDLQKGTRH